MHGVCIRAQWWPMPPAAFRVSISPHHRAIPTWEKRRSPLLRRSKSLVFSKKTLFNTKTLFFFNPDLNVKLLLFKSLVFSEKTLFNT